jgi:hypothetical protein
MQQGASSAIASHAGTAPQSSSAANRVVFASDVVVISAATAKADLVSVSTDGSTYVFKSSAGTLGQLKVGKVMLLQGYSVGVVSSVKKTASRLTVKTTAASVTDVFKDADVQYSQPVDFAKVFASLDPGTKDSAVAVDGTDVGARLPSGSAGLPDPKVKLSFTGTGPGDFTYGISVTPSPTKLDWSLTGCIGASFSPTKGSCASGNTGVSLDATLSGYISKATVSGDFDIVNGRNDHSSYDFLSLGAVHFVYQILSGDTAKKKLELPVLRLPISFDVPFTVLGLPMLLKVQFALLIKAIITSKNSVINGGVKFTYGGSEGVTETGSSDSGAPNSETVKGTFQSGDPSLTLASTAVEVATQMKVGIGPGLSVANILGYGDVITALGQVTPTDASPLLDCSQFYLDVSGHAVLEAQIASLKITSATKQLFDKKASDKRAECGI